MEMTLHRISAGGRPLPAAFIASFQPKARKRSLQSCRGDESNYSEEPNARKRSLRSFRRGESNYKEEPLESLKTLQQQSAEDLLAIREEFNVLELHIQYLILSNQKYLAERDLEILNRWALQARPNLDIADCAEAAALSTTLPQALGEGAFADEPITAEEPTAPEGPVAG